jgi:soluble lytic murein transglycosylase-like protein
MRTTIKLFLPIIMSLFFSMTAYAEEDISELPEEIQETCNKYGEEYNICPELIMAIIERESAGNPDAKNGSCKGLMQISDRWHTERMERLEVTDIYDIDGNIHVGTDYLAELFQEYGEVSTVLMVYHGEENAVKKSKSGQVSKYADGILTRSEELERRHGK